MMKAASSGFFGMIHEQWKRFSLRGHSRPGVSLLEASLSLVIIGLAIDQGIWIVTDYAENRALQAEARMVSAIADDYAAMAGSNLPPAVTLGRVTSYGPPDHIGLETPYGREIRIAHFTPAPGQLVIFVYTWSNTRQTDRKPVPWYDANIRQIGYLAGSNDRCARNHICGPAMDWDATTLLASLGTAGPGREDLIALRWVTLARNAYPYLHRSRVTGHPDLNKMETNLNMGGNDIEGIESIETDNLVIDEGLELGGTLELDELKIAGDLLINGNLVSTGTFRAGNTEAGKDAAITTLNVNELLVIENAAITSDLTIGELQVHDGIEMTGIGGVEVTGTVHANETLVDSLSVTGNLNGAVLDYEEQDVTLSRVETRDMIVNNLTVGNCNNC